KLMDSLIKGILDNLPKILKAGIDLILGLIDGILQMLPELVSAGIKLIMELIATIVGLIPQLISVGIQIVGELIIGVVRSIPRVLNAGKTLVKTIGKVIKSGFKDIGSIGKNLVKGLWDGMSSMGCWVKDEAKGLADGIVGGMKNVFGIKSPSTVMRDIIGKNLMLGIGVGMEAETPTLVKDIDKELSALTRQTEMAVQLDTSQMSMIVVGTGLRELRFKKAAEKVITTINDTIITGNIFYIREKG